jgi:glucosyl-3-phosphoglycerate synthase
VTDYGVDIGLLIDVAERIGVDRMAQVDLGVRVHRNRPLDELAPQAVEVLRTALGRAGVELSAFPAILRRPGEEPLAVPSGERPPLATVAEYARSA